MTKTSTTQTQDRSYRLTKVRGTVHWLMLVDPFNGLPLKQELWSDFHDHLPPDDLLEELLDGYKLLG